MSKQNKTVNSDEVPTPNNTDFVFEEQNVNTPTFVVTRGGCRVSDREYNSSGDTRAVGEKDFWQRVVDRYPDGTRVEIVRFDKKKHRIY